MTIKTCIVCGKEYEAYNKPRKGRRHKYGHTSQKYKRAANSVTCSGECSKEHAKRSKKKYIKKNG